MARKDSGKKRTTEKKKPGLGGIIPEPGDPSVRVNRRDIVSALQRVGVGKGDILFVHSSLSSMGYVVGGPKTVIVAFQGAVGEEGTVAVPSLWYRPDEPGIKEENWDRDSSPAFTGTIAETLRKMPGSYRSDNLSHSVAAIGKLSRELTETHGETGRRPGALGDTSFAADSPWEKLYRWNAAYCFIGVDLIVNTLGHYVEYVLVERELLRLPDSERPRFEARLSSWFVKPGVWPHYNFRTMGELLERQGYVRRSRIGCATLRCIRASDSVDRSLEILLDQPPNWFDGKFVQWLEEIRRVSE